MSVKYLTAEELEAGLEDIYLSPKDNGVIKMIVCRPDVEKRKVLPEAKLDLVEGLVGDNWKARGSTGTPDGSAHPEMQINIMNSRVIALLAQEQERWQLAGDQLYIDMDLSAENLSVGTRLALGSAVLEVTAKPHSGCKKFAARFGQDAIKFVNSPLGKELHLRGVNAKVIQSGIIQTGDIVKKI
jgi:MOSC domain-containing protein YiiM